MGASETVIRVEGLGKQYRLGGRQVAYRTLRESVGQAMLAPLRRAKAVLSGGAAHVGEETFWALRDVSFEVKRGEVLGIIGRNGAGKSTLLKVLSRITEPTRGEVRMRGRVGALLEVGTGFHPELSGRDNIFLNGAILGMRREEIRKKFDDIVAFAEVEKFIDTPVKHYSSGMYMRLAFGIAAHLEPEILIVDEVLAVGDIRFQKKCLEKMDEASHSGKTVLFVSHNMQAIRTLCRRCLLLSDGQVIADASAVEVVGEYYRSTAQVGLTPETGLHDSSLRRGSGAVRFTTVKMLDRSDRHCSEFRVGEAVRFRIAYQINRAIPNLYFFLSIRSSRYSEEITNIRTPLSLDPIQPGMKGETTIELPAPPLRPGDYPLMFWLGDAEAVSFDQLENLTEPLFISTDKTYEELGYDPAAPSGYLSVEFRVVHNVIKGIGSESSLSGLMLGSATTTLTQEPGDDSRPRH